MEKQNAPLFPYEFEYIKPEEQEYLNKMYTNDDSIAKSMRVGPKGYIVYEPYKKDAANIYNMLLRPTDIFVASYQRSGTTWTQELVWLLANNLDYQTAAAIPLTKRYSFLDQFCLIDTNKIDAIVKCSDSLLDKQELRKIFQMFAEPVSGMLEKMPESTPRFIKTHVPMSFLNPNLLESAKMVYIARDPRDVAVSCYHHAKLFKLYDLPVPFKEFWNLFYKHLYIFCPIFEHVKEAWEKRNHPNMLFLFYEELSKDLQGSIQRVATFLGKQLSQEESDRLCEHLSFEIFKNNKSINYEELRELGLLAPDQSFVRKGKSGGWRDYFDEEMTQQAEQWIADNLRDTDLRYPHLSN
ncbi:unnamed protein product [Arctia plantaginis]|uniref:Sulfotransferase domain-containing protein n=1 Tax=Arctia plantaginis TaxID=874455 RepID=A0A8S0Z6R5_ARCPL|nr:unnamed protein product [Arctia plantaginis]